MSRGAWKANLAFIFRSDFVALRYLREYFQMRIVNFGAVFNSSDLIWKGTLVPRVVPIRNLGRGEFIYVCFGTAVTLRSAKCASGQR